MQTRGGEELALLVSRAAAFGIRAFTDREDSRIMLMYLDERSVDRGVSTAST